MTPLLSIDQAAELLNIKRSTLYLWVKERKFPVVRMGSRLLRIHPDDVAAWIKKNTEAANDSTKDRREERVVGRFLPESPRAPRPARAPAKSRANEEGGRGLRAQNHRGGTGRLIDLSKYAGRADG